MCILRTAADWHTLQTELRKFFTDFKSSVTNLDLHTGCLKMGTTYSINTYMKSYHGKFHKNCHAASLRPRGLPCQMLKGSQVGQQDVWVVRHQLSCSGQSTHHCRPVA